MPDLPLKTPEQLVTLASIVEKETGKPDERTRVAAVFVNRLKQQDAAAVRPDDHLRTDRRQRLARPPDHARARSSSRRPTTPIVIDGLPPGPIANPGRASLEAAANPARTKELYFVADGTGGHVFAENYEQHQKNVAQAARRSSSRRTAAAAARAGRAASRR